MTLAGVQHPVDQAGVHRYEFTHVFIFAKGSTRHVDYAEEKPEIYFKGEKNKIEF